MKQMDRARDTGAAQQGWIPCQDLPPSGGDSWREALCGTLRHMAGRKPEITLKNRVVGNGIHCDTTKRASQRLPPHTKGRFPCITEVGRNPLIPQPCSKAQCWAKDVWSQPSRCLLASRIVAKRLRTRRQPKGRAEGQEA